AVVGAGTSATMIVRHLSSVPHVQLVAVINRTIGRAADLIAALTGHRPPEAKTPRDLEAAAGRHVTAVTDNPDLGVESDQVEVIVEATGTVEFAARVVQRAIDRGKHVVLVNAELDSTLGPLLKARADARGVVFTHTDGEEPGVAMTLVRYLGGLGL